MWFKLQQNCEIFFSFVELFKQIELDFTFKFLFEWSKWLLNYIKKLMCTDKLKKIRFQGHIYNRKDLSKKNIAESLIQSVSHFNLTCLFAITQIDSNSIGFSELVVNRLCLNWTAFIAPLSELVDNFNMTPIKTS